jgi:tetratricopeptide (TPR) repeat protein
LKKEPKNFCFLSVSPRCCRELPKTNKSFLVLFFKKELLPSLSGPMPPPYPPQVTRKLADAAQLLRARRPADAIAPLRDAAASMPGDAAILHDLGVACLECGLHAEAVTALQRAIAADPRYADAHLRLGIAWEASGALTAALAAYQRAARLLPSLADAAYRAGDLLDSLGQSTGAASAYRSAAAAAPETTLGRIAAAKALLVENRDADAAEILRVALTHESGNAVALELLGNVLADSGQFAQAREILLRAVAQAPLRAGSYYDIVRCRHITQQDAALVAQMRASLALPGLEAAPRARVHLALGKAADDLGDYPAAMRHFGVAEALRNEIVCFDPAAFEARIDATIAAFPPERVAQASPRATSDATPLLIVGLPRAGTTLVEQILSAHPDVSAGGELPFWIERAGANATAVPSGAARDYLRLLRRIAPHAARVTDKMPLNFQYAGIIHMALPRATFIHVRRNPIDTALSIHQTHFNPRMQFPTGGAALVRYIRAYQRICAHWRSVLPPERFIEIDYQALTSDPEPNLRRLIAACGLAWNDACLRPEQNARVVKTPSKWQARQPIYRTSVGRWRVYENLLGPLAALAEEKEAVLF